MAERAAAGTRAAARAGRPGEPGEPVEDEGAPTVVPSEARVEGSVAGVVVVREAAEVQAVAPTAAAAAAAEWMVVEAAWSASRRGLRAGS